MRAKISSILSLLALTLCSAQAWGGNACVSNATGAFNATGTWTACGGSYPQSSNGDTFSILAAHTVTVSAAASIGASGASGTTAGTVAGTLAVNAPLELKGDLQLNRGGIITGDCTGSNTGSITFAPPSGSTYKWVTNNTGSGYASVALTGTSSNRFAVTTAQGSGGNAWVDDVSGARNAKWTLSDVAFSYFGDATNDGFKQSGLSDYLDLVNDISLTSVSFNHCGRVFIQNNSGGYGTTTIYILSGVSILNSLSTGEVFRFLVNVDKAGGTRSVTNLVIYNETGTAKSAYIAVRDLSLNGLLTHNIGTSSLAAIRTSASGLFMTADVPNNTNTFGSLSGKQSVTLSNSVFLTHYDNPHFFQEASAGSGVANVYQGNVFDGDGYFGTDAGDLFVLQAATASQIKNNISINKAGTLVTTMGSSVAVACDLTNNTMYGSYGAAIGETTGGAGHIARFQNNLAVNQPDGIHKQTSFVPQTGFTLDHNGYWNMINSDTFTTASSDYAYMASVNGNRVGNTTCQTGTDTTHVVAIGNPFSAVVVGDFVIQASKGGARVATVTDANHLVLDQALPGLTSGDVVTVTYNWWSTAGQEYGDGTRGAGDINANPNFVGCSGNIANCTVRGYGGWASVQSAAREMLTVNGIAYDGSATAATTKTVSGALSYIRTGFTPQNAALRNAGYGGVDIGAVAVASTINGACGSNSGATLSSLASGDANNCSTGTVTSFTGSGPWSWTCAGSGGGSSSSTCSASLAAIAGITITGGTLATPALTALGGSGAFTWSVIGSPSWLTVTGSGTNNAIGTVTSTGLPTRGSAVILVTDGVRTASTQYQIGGSSGGWGW
jgi:hypothetical protein